MTQEELTAIEPLIGKTVVVHFKDGRPEITGRLASTRQPDHSPGVEVWHPAEGRRVVDAFVVSSVEEA